MSAGNGTEPCHCTIAVEPLIDSERGPSLASGRVALNAARPLDDVRVLDERGFERLGGSETLHMDARIIALTNTDLQKAVSAGRFR